MSNTIPPVLIAVREYGGTYIARATGMGVTASCTSGDRAAAEACARKLAKSRGVEKWVLQQYGNAAAWIFTDETESKETR
jgi:hypothetical protein